MNRITVLTLVVLSTVATCGQSRPAADKIMALAVKKSQADAKRMFKRYKIEVEKTVNDLNSAAPGQDPKKDHGKPPITVADMFGKRRYDYVSSSRILLDGVQLFEISFRPSQKQPDLPSILLHPHLRVQEEVLDQLEGTVYVNATDYGIERVEARLAQPVGEFYIHIYKAGPITLRQKLNAGVWVPDRLEFKATFQPALGDIKQEQWLYTFAYTSKDK